MPYQEWKDAALALDEYMHFDEWKLVDEDMYYDWKLVRKVRCMPSSHAAEGLLGWVKGPEVAEDVPGEERRSRTVGSAGNLYSDELRWG